MPAKNRTRLQRKQRATQVFSQAEDAKQPHSIVVSRGKVGKNLNQLMLDYRKVMSPYTASNLRVRKGNVMKDFLTIAGPLNVTHLLTFSKTNESVSFRLITTPKGPTMSFKVEEYMLKKDIENTLKRPIGDENLYRQSPLLVMYGFTDTSQEERLTYEAFRALFPRLKPSEAMVKGIRRVVLLNYNKENGTIEFRHYAIQSRLGAKKKIQNLLNSNKEIPDLGKYNSIEEYMNAMSGSDSEAEATQVNNPKTGRQMKVRLTEIGPRMNIRLVKIEDGLCGGQVLWHAFKSKSEEDKVKEEEKRLNEIELKNERKRIQQENVEKKEKQKEAEKKQQEKQKKRDENAAQARRDAKANGKFSKEQLAESGKAPDGTKPKTGKPGQFVKGSTRAERKRAAIANSKGRGGASSGGKRQKLSKNQKSRLL